MLEFIVHRVFHEQTDIWIQAEWVAHVAIWQVLMNVQKIMILHPNFMKRNSRLHLRYASVSVVFIYFLQLIQVFYEHLHELSAKYTPRLYLEIIYTSL